ncbi:hypothetical protein BSU04_13530 [Caballeronia sordidicola]|uniref:Uncharacterized protein n=1 Tax=Caballeronia sordidicola TaxID=196367 RepID=A0A226X4T6_CABSO|nr:hypothetical protein BSU04_13530 [Caballeronia sordidicola]
MQRLFPRDEIAARRQFKSVDLLTQPASRVGPVISMQHPAHEIARTLNARDPVPASALKRRGLP